MNCSKDELYGNLNAFMSLRNSDDGAEPTHKLNGQRTMLEMQDPVFRLMNNQIKGQIDKL